MHTLLSTQQWLYGGMGKGLGEVAGGEPRAILFAMVAAVLFGGSCIDAGARQDRTRIVSPRSAGPAARRHHQWCDPHTDPCRPAVILVLAGFAVISKVFAYGRTPQFEIASGILISAIGGFLVLRALSRDDHNAPREGRTLSPW